MPMPQIVSRGLLRRGRVARREKERAQIVVLSELRDVAAHDRVEASALPFRVVVALHRAAGGLRVGGRSSREGFLACATSSAKSFAFDAIMKCSAVA